MAALLRGRKLRHTGPADKTTVLEEVRPMENIHNGKSGNQEVFLFRLKYIRINSM